MRLVAAFVVFAFGSLPAIAAARGPSPPAADVLFSEGKRLLAQGKSAEACRAFEKSNELEPSVGGRFQIAQCALRAGMTASAWAGYLEVAAMASARGQSAREQAARAKAAELEPRLVRLRVDVAGSGT